jgi:hypothetical protein
VTKLRLKLKNKKKVAIDFKTPDASSVWIFGFSWIMVSSAHCGFYVERV